MIEVALICGTIVFMWTALLTMIYRLVRHGQRVRHQLALEESQRMTYRELNEEVHRGELIRPR